MSKKGTPNDSTKPDISDNDSTRFADLLKQVKPLHPEHNNLAEDYKPKLSPTPKETLKDEKKVLQESLEVSLNIEYEDIQPGDSLSFCRPGIQKNIFRKLKKGQFSIAAELDLHGLRVMEAQHALANFIQTCRERGLRCVRIIHGKGYRSSNQGPKIKPMVNQWLQQRDEILAFCSARPIDGGTGAVYVLLKALW